MPRPTSPSSVPMRPIQSTEVSPYVSVTAWLVGTTTIMFGATRYGPSAPSTSQLGKYDVRTSTGLAISSTWNEIVLGSSRMSDTFVGTIAAWFVVARSLMSTCFHDFGPVAVHTLSSCDAFMNQGAAAHSHGPSSGIGVESVHCWPQHCS